MKITIMRTYLLSGMRTIFSAEADGDDVPNAVGAVEFYASQAGATAIYENSSALAAAEQTTSAPPTGTVPTPTTRRPRRTAEQKAADETAERAAAAAKAAASFQPGGSAGASIPQPTVPAAGLGVMAPPLVSMAPTPPQVAQHVGFAPNPVGAPPAPQPYHVPQFSPAPTPTPVAPPPSNPKGPHWDAWYSTVDTQIRTLTDHAPPHLAPQVQASVNAIVAKHGGGAKLEQLNEAQMSAIFGELQQAYPPVPAQGGARQF